MLNFGASKPGVRPPPDPLVKRQTNGMHRTAVLSQKTPADLILCEKEIRSVSGVISFCFP